MITQEKRWEILLAEYEVLDAYWANLQRIIWSSLFVFLTLSLVGLAFMGVGFPAGQPYPFRVVTLISWMAIVISLVWWLLLRHLTGLLAVATFRRQEIEKALGMRRELYITSLIGTKGMRLSERRGWVRRLAEGDPQLEADLEKATSQPNVIRWFPAVIQEETIWNTLPWVLAIAWAILWVFELL